ncbi:UPF0149 family protein [Psychromonas antarctica]|uniref:UPF0149 family protein n=1 Tax=Psychromonas antarctica TaxID=67573 RepID=UPI001EE82912|nr:UPF0149 family protein [Psychromonas antarctica]MCG6200006.1 YecA family protein [Psychromonas antarctica]
MKAPVIRYQALNELFCIPEIKTNGRAFDEMLGIVCAIATSPTCIDLADWFPLLWDQEMPPSFSNENLAADFAAAVLQFYDDCLMSYQQSTPLSLPTERWLNESLQVTDAGRSFACGYLLGLTRIEASWQNHSLQLKSDPLLQTTQLLLSKMTTVKSNDPQMQSLFMELPDMQEIINALPRLLSALGSLCLSKVQE